MQNLTTTTRWADFVAAEPPIAARDIHNNSVGPEWKGTFLDPAGLAFLLQALATSGVPFDFEVNPDFTLNDGELRKPYTFTIIEGESVSTFEAKQILSVALTGAPGKLSFRAGQFRFIPDPPPAPQARPNPGPTTGDDLRNTSGVVGDPGSFTAEDRIILKDIYRLVRKAR